MKQDRTDVYNRITAEIIAAIEAGAGEFKMPWHHTGTSIARPTNIASGKGYRGVNVLALWIGAEIARYDSGLWGTYRQWQALEAQIRKGERGTTVVLWKQANAASDDDGAGDEDSPARRIFARAFTVFNVARVDGYQPTPVALLPDTERVAHAEAFIRNLGITTVFGSPNAYYRPATDTVDMPDFGHFHDAAGVLRRERNRRFRLEIVLDEISSSRLRPRPAGGGYRALGERPRGCCSTSLFSPCILHSVGAPRTVRSPCTEAPSQPRLP